MSSSAWTSALVFVILFISACGTGNGDCGGNDSNSGPITPPTSKPSPSPTSPTSATNGRTVSPTPTLSPLPPDAKGVQSAIDIVHEYYAAINARDYRKAYELWVGKGEASGQTFDEFRDVYADTESVEVDTSGEPGDLEGAAGSQYVRIPMRLKARAKDGRLQNFWGEYTLRRSMVDGATAEQRMWRIHSAQFKELP